MNKLDALKKEWKNQKFDLQLSKDELHQLTQKKSVSSIKWIFIFSCFEFFAYLLFPFFIPDYFDAFEYYRSIHLYHFFRRCLLCRVVVVVRLLMKHYQHQHQHQIVLKLMLLMMIIPLKRHGICTG